MAIRGTDKSGERVVGGRKQTFDPGSGMWFDAGPVTPIIDEPVLGHEPWHPGASGSGLKGHPRTPVTTTSTPVPAPLPIDTGDPQGGGTFNLMGEGESPPPSEGRLYVDPATNLEGVGKFTRAQTPSEAGEPAPGQLSTGLPGAVDLYSPIADWIGGEDSPRTPISPVTQNIFDPYATVGGRGEALGEARAGQPDAYQTLFNIASVPESAVDPATVTTLSESLEGQAFMGQYVAALDDPSQPLPTLPPLQFANGELTAGSAAYIDLLNNAAAMRQQRWQQEQMDETDVLIANIEATRWDLEHSISTKKIFQENKNFQQTHLLERNREANSLIIATKQLALDEILGRATNTSAETIAQIRADAEKEVMIQSGKNNQDVARIQENIARFEARQTTWRENLRTEAELEAAKYEADINKEIAQQTGIDSKRVAMYNLEAATYAADKQYEAAQRVGELNRDTAVEVARLTGEAEGAVQKYISDAQKEIAAANNMHELDIVNIQNGFGLTVAANRNMTEKDIENIRAQANARVAELAGLSQESVAASYAEAQIASAQKEYDAAIATAATTKEISEKQLVNDLAIATSVNTSTLEIANVRASAELAVAKENGISSRDVAAISSGAATSSASIMAMSETAIAQIQADVQERMAESLNVSRFDIANLEANAQVQAAQATATGGRNFQQQQLLEGLQARGGLSAQERLDEIAAQTGVTRDVVTLQTASDTAIANATNVTQEAIAGIRASAERDVALATGLSEQAVASINAGAAEEAVETQTLSDQQIAQIQADVQREIATQTGLDQIQIAQIQANAQMSVARGGLTPEERLAETGLRERGGLSPEQRLAEMQAQQAMVSAQARGGLTPEQRLAEIQAQQQGQNLASVLALLSNPQALGALVGLGLPMAQGQGVMGGSTTQGVPSGLAQLFGGQGIPTMAQASQFTPAIANLLTGLAASQGVQPTTLGQLIQSVTPLGGGTASTFAV